MPQLDKYIFFNQIVTLTIFFVLIYLYVRGTLIPKLSTSLKYRKKKLDLLKQAVTGYTDVLRLSQDYNNKKGLQYNTQITKSLTGVFDFYQKNSNTQIRTIVNDVKNIKKSDNKIKFLTLKNKIELKRLSSIKL